MGIERSERVAPEGTRNSEDRRARESSNEGEEVASSVFDLVELKEHHCRVEFTARLQDKTVKAVCGKVAAECTNRHQMARDEGKRREPGGYSPLTGHSFTGHALADGVYLNPTRLQEARERQEQAAFQSAPPTTPARRRGTAPEVPDTPRPVRLPQGHGASPIQWLGLINDLNLRVLATTPAVVTQWQELGYRHRHTFSNYDEATHWLEQGVPSDPHANNTRGRARDRRNEAQGGDDSDPESPSSHGSSQSDRSRETPRPSRRQARRQSDQESESDDTHRSPSRHRHRSRRGRKHRKSKRSARRRRRAPSSSSSSEESQGPTRRHSHGLPRAKSLIGGDRSTGEEELFGMEIGSDELLASLGPEGMKHEMRAGLFDFPTDVLSLPGAYGGNPTGASQGDPVWGDPDQWINQVNALLKTTPEGRDREHDPNWKASSHQALSKVNSLEGLNQLIDGYQRTLSRATKFETQRLTHWMRREGYQSKDTERYLLQGGLPILLRELAKYYFALLMKIQSEANKTAPRWSNTYAEGMLKYHARELAYIRSMSGTREDLILTNYTYLRDAYKSKFTSLELQDTVIKESLLREPSAAGHQGGASINEATKRKGCRCQNPRLHKTLNIKFYEEGAEQCPVASAPNAQKARAAAKLLITKIDDHDGTPTSSQWKGWASKAVSAANDGRSSL